ncbi:sugar ABC transporter substrate-binding protein [Kineococcus sp. NPDC059986]|uniref:ABC transporter substrate-binding protein n=1 Tax=Kineococcus sp. NPDC059986 TaxID=3155538 RepID=UPI003450788A
MGNGARRRWRVTAAVVALTATVALTGCGSGSSGGGDGKVTLKFSQWWDPELPKGALQGLVDDFEKTHSNIDVQLVSGPYASVQDQTFTNAAAGTLSDVVGLDGAWVSDLKKQGALANLTDLMKESGYDDSQLAAQVKEDGSTYMIPAVNFVYPLFVNTDLLAKAGVSAVPTTRSQFSAAASKVTALGGQTKGWVIPLSTQNPNGIQNDLMSWAWASGGSMLKDGQPDVTNAQVTSAANFVKSLYDAGDVTPGALTLQETDKVTEFTNGRVGMMIDSLSHIDTIKQAAPNLKFTVAAIPTTDGFSGKPGIPYAAWGLGVSNSSDHKKEAFEFVQYLMSKDVNSKLSTLANAFPGNKESAPDFTGADPLYQQAFEIYGKSTPVNEFVGLPTSEELMRDFDTNFQKALAGDQSVEQALAATQAEWKEKF